MQFLSCWGLKNNIISYFRLGGMSSPLAVYEQKLIKRSYHTARNISHHLHGMLLFNDSIRAKDPPFLTHDSLPRVTRNFIYGLAALYIFLIRFFSRERC
jgi:hypothetical protein